jgi:hypothetical protein
LGNFIKPPSARKLASQRGFARNCGTNGSIAAGFHDSSSFIPLRRSRSRNPATAVSIVTTRAEYPALRARSMAAIAQSRPPTR